jgi:hypothetical protein
MKGIDVSRYDSSVLVAGIAMDTVEDRGNAERAQASQIFNECFDGSLTCGAQGKGVEDYLIESRDIVLAGGEMLHDFVKVTAQGALPAESVNALAERGRHQFIETFYDLDAGVSGRRIERR